MEREGEVEEEGEGEGGSEHGGLERWQNRVNRVMKFFLPTMKLASPRRAQPQSGEEQINLLLFKGGCQDYILQHL